MFKRKQPRKTVWQILWHWPSTYLECWQFIESTRYFFLVTMQLKISYYNCLCSQQTFTCSKSTIKTLSRCDICLKITMKTPEWCHWRCSGIFLVNFEHISHLFLVSLQMFASVVWLVPIHFLPPNSQARKNTTLHLNMHKTSVSIRRTGWWSI